MQLLEDKDEHVTVSVGILLQPWFQVTVPGSEGSGACGSATHSGCSAGIGPVDGDGPSLDFFLRRVRFLAWGQINRVLSYGFDIDEANLGRGGNFALNTIVQDAFLTYSFSPELRIDAGHGTPRPLYREVFASGKLDEPCRSRDLWTAATERHRR